jgi:hypothetical protein
MELYRISGVKLTVFSPGFKVIIPPFMTLDSRLKTMRHFIIDTTLDSHVDKKDRWTCIQIQEIKVNVKRKSVKGIFQVHSFDDNGHHVIYMPALNLTAYGDNNEEASQMLDVIVEVFFTGCLLFRRQIWFRS